MLQKHNDKIDHWQLFNKLLNIHVPVFKDKEKDKDTLFQVNITHS